MVKYDLALSLNDIGKIDLKDHIDGFVFEMCMSDGSTFEVYKTNPKSHTTSINAECSGSASKTYNIIGYDYVGMNILKNSGGDNGIDLLIYFEKTQNSNAPNILSDGDRLNLDLASFAQLGQEFDPDVTLILQSNTTGSMYGTDSLFKFYYQEL